MDALSIAFDIIVVGALALPWAFLVTHLFFSDHESSLNKLVRWVKDQDQPALVGVLLFAMAYPLGSAVSRIAQDFFDDDDLHIQFFHHLFRVGVTESSIRTDVFCNTFNQWPAATKPSGTDPKSSAPPAAECEQSTDAKINESPAGKSEPFKTSDSKASDLVEENNELFRRFDPKCIYTGRWVIQTCDPHTHMHISADWIKEQEDRAGDVFHVHEATVLLRGTDQTERLRQFHDQIVVLRGAAFNGMIAFSCCLLWWISRFRSRWRYAALSLYLFPGIVASVNHLSHHIDDPPYMEFTFLVLAAAGGCLLWQRRPQKEAALQARDGRGEIRFAYLLLSLFLTVSAFLGWWATQVLYDQQVIYSYKALSADSTKDPTK
jgi:hypothetical protein